MAAMKGTAKPTGCPNAQCALGVYQVVGRKDHALALLQAREHRNIIASPGPNPDLDRHVFPLSPLNIDHLPDAGVQHRSMRDG